MITPEMWIGFIFGSVTLVYVIGRIFVDGYDWTPRLRLPRINRHTPRHRRNP